MRVMASAGPLRGRFSFAQPRRLDAATPWDLGRRRHTQMDSECDVGRSTHTRAGVMLRYAGAALRRASDGGSGRTRLRREVERG